MGVVVTMAGVIIRLNGYLSLVLLLVVLVIVQRSDAFLVGREPTNSLSGRHPSLAQVVARSQQQPAITDGGAASRTLQRRAASYRHGDGRKQQLRRATSSSSSRLFGMFDQSDDIEGVDKIKSCIPYLLPLMDGDQFGQYIYSRIPPLGFVNDLTIGPLAALAHKIPFLTLGLFIALTLGTRFNTDTMSRNLRFNAQQAALIDVALIFPELIGAGFEQDPVPQYIAEPCSNFVWYAYMSAVIYSVYSNLIRGKKPDKIPYLSSSAELMVGPF